MTQSGLISSDDFIKVLNYRDLGLQLNEAEILYIAEQSDLYGNGSIPFIQVAPVLPEILRILYNQRAEQCMVRGKGQCCIYPSNLASLGLEIEGWFHFRE